jgi:hypothetical protein
MLGYRGHFMTKSRSYSTTLSALRQVRRDHRAAEARQSHGQQDPLPGHIITEARWRFTGSGYRPGEAMWAEATRDRIRQAQHIEQTRNAS